MNKEQATSIVLEVESISQNIKAEIIVANLLNLGLSENEITILREGCFTRPFRKDVIKINVNESENDCYGLNISLTRNGIYDLLPEGITHKQDTNSSNKNVKTFTSDYKRRKTETTMARKFFEPLENEFFSQQVSLERKEQELLYHAHTSFYEFLISFWKIKRMPQPYESFLLRLMPYMHSFAGNFQTLCLCLQEILKVPVSFDIKHRVLENSKPKQGNNTILKLGQNFTAGKFVYAVPLVVFTFGPVSNKRLKEFLLGGVVHNFLQEFYKYTIPFESDVESKILSDRFKRENYNADYGVLGYSACL